MIQRVLLTENAHLELYVLQAGYHFGTRRPYNYLSKKKFKQLTLQKIKNIGDFLNGYQREFYPAKTTKGNKL